MGIGIGGATSTEAEEQDQNNKQTASHRGYHHKRPNESRMESFWAEHKNCQARTESGRQGLCTDPDSVPSHRSGASQEDARHGKPAIEMDVERFG